MGLGVEWQLIITAWMRRSPGCAEVCIREHPPPPRVYCGSEDGTFYCIYCSISQSSVLLDHRLKVLMQSTGESVIMSQYICIMQNGSLCLGKAAQLIHSSQFCLLWKCRWEKTSPRRNDITDAPGGLVSSEVCTLTLWCLSWGSFCRRCQFIPSEP